MGNEAKHTPGPWAFDAYVSAPVLARELRTEDGRFVAFIGGHGENGISPGAPDARLIAAAPELLEALKQIALGEGRYSRDPLEHASNTIDDMKALAVAAIAKAEGK